MRTLPSRAATMTLVVALGCAFTLTACSTEARAERKGKQFGNEVCKAKNADNADEAQRHVRRAADKLDDLNRYVGRDVRQDLRASSRNVDQLVRDVSAGRDVREQDVNAVVQNIHEAAASTTGAARAAYDGILEGLSNCT
jgi:hypothetical protein